MLKYSLKRIGIGLVSLFMLVTITFLLVRLMPGSPFQTANVSEQIQQKIEEEYGLDKPLMKQYGTYMNRLLHGDLGVSYKKSGVTVVAVIRQAAPDTMRIGGLAALTAYAGGTALGIWQVLSKNTRIRRGIVAGTILGTCIPNFVIALVTALLFGVHWKLLPIVGLNGWKSYILPVLTLSCYPMAVVTRIMKNSFEKELSQDYVIMARAKHLSKCRIIVRHVLKNAWIPVLNYIGPSTAFLMTGSFVVESIFAIPGLGREFVNSIVNRDYTLILGLTIFMGAIVILINLMVDLLCAWLNPKIRMEYLMEQ